MFWRRLLIFYDFFSLYAAKNVILAGVKSVTLYDPAPVELYDLATQFFLDVKDIGKPRAATCVSRLAELNSYVPVRSLDGDLPMQALLQFKVCLFICSWMDVGA